MKDYDIVLLTESRYENPKKIDALTQNVLDDDKHVQKALEKRGLNVIRKDWTCKNFDWNSAHYAVFRTTWDYFDKFEAFIQWIEKVRGQVTFINPVETVLNNLDKRYLEKLNEKGIRVIPTVYIEKGQSASLENLHQSKGWNNTILKPVISAGAKDTYRINSDSLNSNEEIFQHLIHKQAMMLQPFQENIPTQGETSFVLFDGKFTHAVLKKAKAGDFRVQDDFGGTVEVYHPSQEEIIFAENVVQKYNPIPIYARVDIIHDNDDQLCVVEVELIEPELWFRLYPKAADVFADTVVKYINSNNIH